MGEILGGFGVSHAPSIASTRAAGHEGEPDWKPLFDAFDHVRRRLLEEQPDALVVIYNDHAEEFFLDRCPTFAIGVADRFPVRGHDEPLPPVPGHRELGLHIATAGIDAGIDFTVCHEQGVDDGVVVPLPLIDDEWQFPVVPICVNVVWEPRPSPARCFAMGEAVGAAIRSFPDPMRVAVVATGGLSHTLVGPEFGSVHPEWDRTFLRQMAQAPDELCAYTMAELEEVAGHEGVEVVQWIAMRGALGDDCRPSYTCYHPYRMTGYAVACYEPANQHEVTKV